MKNCWRKAWLGAAAGMALAVTCAGAAHAAVLVRTDFQGWSTAIHREGGDEETRDGGGWRAKRGGISNVSQGRLWIDLAKVGLNPDEGAFDFTIRRDEQEGKETLFTLYDKSGETIYAQIIDWDGDDGWAPPPPALLTKELWWTYSPRDEEQAWGAPWIPRVPFSVGRGQTFRITITWKTGQPDGLYINGRKIRTVNRENGSFAAFVKQAATMDIGVERGGESFSHQMRSVLKDFRILDVATGAHVEERALAVGSVGHDARRVAGFSGKLVAGNAVTVTVVGAPGAVGTFDIVHYPDVAAKIDVDWRGWGIYRDPNKVFYEEGEVNLRDVEGYEVYVSQTPFDAAAPGMEPTEKVDALEQFYTLETPEVDKPYYIAVLAVMRDGSRRPVIKPIVNQPLAETRPGIYTGAYHVGWADKYARAVVVGHLAKAGRAASLVGAETLAMDPSLVVSVATDPSEMMADEKSQANISVVLTDANGKPVSDHEVKFSLFTTSQYTGVVGGGAFVEQVGGAVNETTFGKTDLFGRVGATYRAGFAAKTAIIVARDMLSNSTGSAWVKSYIRASASLELEPTKDVLADEGYAISITSSDAWLTADGRSQARITAVVTRGGLPVPDRVVVFTLAPSNGALRTVSGTTDRNGAARAVYTAGKKIGFVTITAAEPSLGLSASLQIELRSDAPAKLKIKVDPEKIPADGRSTADLFVTVTDINDNPNENVEVEYRIASGGGRLGDDKGITNRSGESSTQYTAGRNPGTVKFEITVRSTVPTEQELAKAREMAVTVPDYKFF